MDELNTEVMNDINKIITQVDGIVVKYIPIELSKLAQEIFDSKGKSHGRSWDTNTVSTAKRKGFNKRNVESGQLEDTLIGEGFLLDDDYMNNLPTPDSGDSNGYFYANSRARFDDIGRTDDDDTWLKDQLIKDIINELK